MTRASLENAHNGKWEQVIRDEQLRRRMISELFSEPLDVQEAVEFRDILQELLQLSRKLEQITAEARDRSHEEAGSISKGRRAMAMYSANIG